MINTVSEINYRLNTDPAAFIAECDKEYRSKIKAVAAYISDNRHIRLISIAGPSGAGKTTTANILCAMLEEIGIDTLVVSLDDFYYSRDIVDLGKVDPESVEALNTELLHDCVTELLEKGAARLPIYDFKSGTSHKNAKPTDLKEYGILILEGIHGLNPVITEALPKDRLLKLYISAYTPFENEKGEVVLTGRKLRLVRRSLRDRRFRNSDILRTLSFWGGVVEAEDRFLYGFIRYADFHIHTMHAFEPALYRDEFIEMVKALGKAHPFYEYVSLICLGLSVFTNLSPTLIPENSLIREFIGS